MMLFMQYVQDLPDRLRAKDICCMVADLQKKTCDRRPTAERGAGDGIGSCVILVGKSSIFGAHNRSERPVEAPTGRDLRAERSSVTTSI
jgi:hypothetical protein